MSAPKRLKRKSNNEENIASAKRIKIGSILHHQVSKPTLHGMDKLFLCVPEEGEKCTPVANSDVLLAFLNQTQYKSIAYIESIFKTLQQMIPSACFLHPIGLDISGGTSKFIITKHTGRNSEKEALLNLAKYKENVIEKCKPREGGGGDQKPLMAIPFGLKMGHMNMLIIDPNRETFEHFEPHGAKFYSGGKSKLINTEIERATRQLCQEWFPGYAYIPRDDATNFQVILNRTFAESKHGGTCAIWSIWYAYLRLSHPEFERTNIIEQSRKLLGQNDFAELEHFIIQFVMQLNSILDFQMIGNTFFNADGRRYEKRTDSELLNSLLERIQHSYPKVPNFDDDDILLYEDLREKKFRSQCATQSWKFTHSPPNFYDFKYGVEFALLAIDDDQLPTQEYVSGAIQIFKYFKNDTLMNNANSKNTANNSSRNMTTTIPLLLPKIASKTLNNSDVKQIGAFVGAVHESSSRLFMAHFQKTNDMHLGMVFVLLLKMLFEFFENPTMSKKEMYEKIYQHF
jgi:hypothetical protein